MQKKSYTPILVVGLGLILLCFTILIYSMVKPIPVTNVEGNTNVVTNEIVNKVVKYEDLTIEDVDQAIAVASEKVSDAVIGVSSKVMTRVQVGFTTTWKETDYSTGSGVIYKQVPIYEGSVLVDYEYYVVTNRHVVTIDVNDLTKYNQINVYAYLGDEDLEIEAEVLGYDAKVDIALLKFNCNKNIEPVKFANIDSVKKGNLAIAVGNPSGYDYYGSVTFGVISSPCRYISTDTDGDSVNDFYAEYIQHDVAINPGNSGGGLFNLKGELIGINTLKIVEDKVDNMGFAIPIDVVEVLLKEYLEVSKEIIRPRLGILGSEIRALSDATISSSPELIIPDIYGSEKRYGLYVSEVYENTTIATTPIDVNDIILEINDVKIIRMYLINSKLNSLTDGYKVGEEITIKYYDSTTGKIETCKAILKA